MGRKRCTCVCMHWGYFVYYCFQFKKWYVCYPPQKNKLRKKWSLVLSSIKSMYSASLIIWNSIWLYGYYYVLHHWSLLCSLVTSHNSLVTVIDLCCNELGIFQRRISVPASDWTQYHCLSSDSAWDQIVKFTLIVMKIYPIKYIWVDLTGNSAASTLRGTKEGIYIWPIHIH